MFLGTGACALAVLVAAGGWTGGRIHSGESPLPFGPWGETAAAGGGGGPEAEEAVGVPEPEEEGERVEYRGMSVLLPEGWTFESVQGDLFATEAPGPGSSIEDDWMALYPEDQAACADSEWSWGDVHSACEHLKLLGPGGIRYGGAGYMPLETLEDRNPFNAFTPGGNPAPCSVDREFHLEGSPEYRGFDEWEFEEVRVGSEIAQRTEGSALCYSLTNTPDWAFFVQRLWLLEGPRILVVDSYELEEAEEILDSAEW